MRITPPLSQNSASTFGSSGNFSIPSSLRHSQRAPPQREGFYYAYPRALAKEQIRGTLTRERYDVPEEHARALQAKKFGLFTVGHSTRAITEFLELLKSHGVKRVIDVRTIPRSRHNPQFNREALAVHR